MRRRAFLAGGLAAGALLGCRPWARPRGGDAAMLDEHERATIVAIAETFLPGGDGAPGATDVDAYATIADPAYGVTPYLAEVVADVDAWCVARRLRTFVALSPEDREVALEERMGLRGMVIASWYRPAYEGILALTKLAYFGGLRGGLGLGYLAFPGASRGWAPASAGGAWAAADTPRPLVVGGGSTIRIDGAGAIATVRASVVAVGEDARATLRVKAPDGRFFDLAVRSDDGGRVVVNDVELPVLAGGPAAGAWRLEIGRAAGGGELAAWSLRVRTDLDEATWRR
ncbi:MAG: hypothetical protein KIT31_29105 [Deltaproteobacteria bacterium]|nr:hypothetical protein [Deltaproteobacteria bacterium]